MKVECWKEQENSVQMSMRFDEEKKCILAEYGVDLQLCNSVSFFWTSGREMRIILHTKVASWTLPPFLAVLQLNPSHVTGSVRWLTCWAVLFFLTCIFLPRSFLLQVTYLITRPWLFPTFPKYLSPDRLETLLKCHFQELFGGHIVQTGRRGGHAHVHTRRAAAGPRTAAFICWLFLYFCCRNEKKESIFSQRESREVYCVLKVSVWRLSLARP